MDIKRPSKKRNKTKKERYNTYKALLETPKKKSRNSHCSNLIDKYQINIKKTWDVMKEITAKSKFKIKKLQNRIVVDKKEIINEKTIAEKFYHFL